MSAGRGNDTKIARRIPALRGVGTVNLKLERRGSRAAQAVLLSVSLSALLAGAPALAAPVNNWTGLYAGFYAGGVWGQGKSTASSDCPPSIGGGPPGGYYCDATAAGSSANANAVTSAASGSVSSTKFTGGIQAGYNWQTGAFVYGVEADFGAFRVKASRSTSGVYPASGSIVGPAPGDPFAVTNSFSTDWLITARGRLGWAASNWLVYATGGLAMSRIKVEDSFSDASANETATASKIKVGWTLGAGMEVALTKNWSLKGEYLYVDLGSVSTLGTVENLGSPGYANALGVSTSLTAHIARLGANFRF